MKRVRWFVVLLIVAGLAWRLFSKTPVDKPTAPTPTPPAPPAPTAITQPELTPLEPRPTPSRAEATKAIAVGVPALPAPTPAPKAKPRPLKDRVLRDEEGLLLRSSQEGAAKACAARGMRLPTFRELAELAVTRGAKGIIETSDFTPEHHGKAYFLVKPLNPDGFQDAFYYNSIGYKEPVFQAARAEFWSSSTCVNCVIGGEGGNSAYSMDAETGDARDRYADVTLAVRCVGEEPAAWLDSDKE